jgi:hypothetical protein
MGANLNVKFSIPKDKKRDHPNEQPLKKLWYPKN